MLLLTVFVLGVFFTSWPLTFYLTNSETYLYLLKCATLINGVSFELPGVFYNVPYRHMVNGSLWTMPYEIKMYAILAVIWVALRIIRMNRLRLFQLAIVISAVIAGVWVISSHFYFPTGNSFASLFYMFLSGAAFFVLKEKISLSRSFFWLLVIALFATAMGNKSAFFIIYELAIAYILFYVAYVPSGYIRKYNQVGDYSYGIYIYAFPIQQSMAALFPGISIWSMQTSSVTTTLLLAALSWHLIEQRALGLKDIYVGNTRKLFTSV